MSQLYFTFTIYSNFHHNNVGPKGLMDGHHGHDLIHKPFTDGLLGLDMTTGLDLLATHTEFRGGTITLEISLVCPV